MIRRGAQAMYKRISFPDLRTWLPMLGTRPPSGIKAPFASPWFVLAFAGIRWRVVQTKAIDKDDLPPSEGWRGCAPSMPLTKNASH